MKKSRRREDESALMEHHLRMEELGEKMTSSRNCELTMMLSTSIESEQEDTEKQHDECFLGQIFGFLRSKYLGERQPLASIAENRVHVEDLRRGAFLSGQTRIDESHIPDT